MSQLSNPIIDLVPEDPAPTSIPSPATVPGPAPLAKKFQCPHCAQAFTRHHNLKSHLLIHSQEKKFVCDTCSSKFRRIHDLKRHLKLHTGERPYLCQKCGRRFARGDALIRHTKASGTCSLAFVSGVATANNGTSTGASSTQGEDLGQQQQQQQQQNSLLNTGSSSFTGTANSAANKTPASGAPQKRQSNVTMLLQNEASQPAKQGTTDYRFATVEYGTQRKKSKSISGSSTPASSTQSSNYSIQQQAFSQSNQELVHKHARTAIADITNPPSPPAQSNRSLMLISSLASNTSNPNEPASADRRRSEPSMKSPGPTSVPTTRHPSPKEGNSQVPLPPIISTQPNSSRVHSVPLSPLNGPTSIANLVDQESSGAVSTSSSGSSSSRTSSASNSPSLSSIMNPPLNPKSSVLAESSSAGSEKTAAGSPSAAGHEGSSSSPLCSKASNTNVTSYNDANGAQASSHHHGLNNLHYPNQHYPTSAPFHLSQLQSLPLPSTLQANSTNSASNPPPQPSSSTSSPTLSSSGPLTAAAPLRPPPHKQGLPTTTDPWAIVRMLESRVRALEERLNSAEGRVLFLEGQVGAIRQ